MTTNSKKTKKEEKKELQYTTDPKDFSQFTLSLQNEKLKEPLANTLANIFSMRFIGNKTHGDMAEVGLTEFINKFIDDYECIHVGKEYYRSKKHEEDIAVCKQREDRYLPISLKAYGVGPLQLSTDKENVLYKFLNKKLKNKETNETKLIKDVVDKIKETGLFNIFILPLIYKEGKGDSNGGKCNVLLFESEKMLQNLSRIVYVDKQKEYDYTSKKVHRTKKGKSRKYPIYLFLDGDNDYICEVRYGGANANALQRGLWSKTSIGDNKYFINLFDEWIEYNKREKLLTLIRQALNSTESGHEIANEALANNISTSKPNLNTTVK